MRHFFPRAHLIFLSGTGVAGNGISDHSSNEPEEGMGMDRKQFLTLFGSGAAVAACTYCLSGCKSPDAITGPTNANMTVDISQPENSALGANGGYVYKNGIIIARTVSGSYVAVSMACTHQGTTIVYDKNTNQFFCPAHGSRFATDGSVVNGPAGSPLTRYTVSVSGNILTITS
jgi:cytochrome b6-f complex iron-sulfur subunit